MVALFRKPGTVTTAMENSTEVSNLEDQRSYEDYIFRSMILGCCLISVSITGIIGNAISISIFSRASMRSSINILLAGLSAVDLTLLILAILMFGLQMIDPYMQTSFIYDLQPFSLKIIYPMNLITQTCSVWTMVAITVERWVAVCHPLKAKAWCTIRKSWTVLIIIILSSIMYNLVRFWEFNIDPDSSNGYVQYLKNATAFPYYATVYCVFMYLVINFLLPFLLLISFNCQVVQTIVRAHHVRAQITHQEKREHRTAIMMVVVILIFGLCNTLPLVLNFMENFFVKDFFRNPATFLTAYSLNDLSNLLVAFNSATTFIIYILFSQRYRNQLKMLFRCCLPQRCTAGLYGSESTYYFPSQFKQAYMKGLNCDSYHASLRRSRSCQGFSTKRTRELSVHKDEDGWSNDICRMTAQRTEKKRPLGRSGSSLARTDLPLSLNESIRTSNFGTGHHVESDCSNISQDNCDLENRSAVVVTFKVPKLDFSSLNFA